LPEYEYPAARLGDDADDHHGDLVRDPYRWLEDTDSAETAAWIKAQNELTERFLETVPERQEIRARLTELWDYPDAGVPFERGGRWFQLRRAGLQNQPVLYVADAPAGEGRVLLDPNLLAEDGTVAVGGVQVTDDGSLIAYATSSAGSDWKVWRVRDVATGEDREDLLEWCKFSQAAWRRDGSGFYYSRLEPPAPGTEYLSENRLPRVFFHRLGDRQGDDQLAFATPDQPEWLHSASVTDDGRFVVMSVSRGTFPESQLHVLDLDRPDAGFRPLVGDFASRVSVVTNVGSTFYLVTDYQAERSRLVAVDLADPGRDHWREVVPEAEHTLLDAHFFGGRLVCHYLRHATSVLRVVSLDGAHIRDIPLPGIAALAESFRQDPGIQGRADSDLMHFKVASFTDSGSLWSHHLGTGETTLVSPAAAAVDPDAFVTEQVFATSADGTRIPVFLSRRRDIEPSGDVPALLYGYGGFDNPVTPSFSVANVVWMERGGLFAVANLRGGGEYGRSWHDSGRLANKQNVFDDFCACARWLAESGWSRRERIAINGRSNGGLLVGACLTQHPELFGATVPEVGVLDMLRFHKFTIGWAWTSDFGDPDDPGQYQWVRAYSPLQNIGPGTSYPPTLITTGDHDDRVAPGHSLKFAAALQRAQGGPAPILIRVETAAGHGAGKPTAKLIAERTDVLAFLEAALGSPAQP
jgi:prolyl oligopeptidase